MGFISPGIPSLQGLQGLLGAGERLKGTVTKRLGEVSTPTPGRWVVRVILWVKED